ncbi:DJ-1 family protein [Besnoitia besnoiti]|uniref:DJ-1 family protein n=1 Tax=Besnoitia besnoiti TaxID=94643 RepID=A0A2A9MLB9_BESBE|nr:DJ-1 family protein [Besnoitia besnoiti]PFH37111.1 DJ-1 family protein [Besnoitia besnoiti]
MSPLSFVVFLCPLLLCSVTTHARSSVPRAFSSFLKPQTFSFLDSNSPRLSRRFLSAQKPPPRLFASSNKMTVKVLVPIAQGSEEIEAVCIIDVLRRAGAEVTVASVEATADPVEMSRGVFIKPDVQIAAVEGESFDCIAVPGGMPGAGRCRDSAVLTSMLKKQKEQGKWIAAICASPAVVLHSHGLLQGEKAVAYPCFMDKFPADMRGEGRVCVSNKTVTSVGPSSAIEFSVKLIEVLFDAAKAKKVAGDMLC